MPRGLIAKLDNSPQWSESLDFWCWYGHFLRPKIQKLGENGSSFGHILDHFKGYQLFEFYVLRMCVA